MNIAYESVEDLGWETFEEVLKDAKISFNVTFRPGTVDVARIAKGVYELMDRDEQGAVAFGMMPMSIMGPVESRIKEKLQEAACKQFQVPEKYKHRLKIDQKFLNEVFKDLAVAIMAEAKRHGKMLC